MGSKLFFLLAIVLVALIGTSVIAHSKQSPSFVKSSVHSTKVLESKTFTQKVQQVAMNIGHSIQQSIEKGSGAVLGEATHFFQKKASDSAQVAATIVTKTAAETLVDQINKLPSEQKKIVRDQLCKP